MSFFKRAGRVLLGIPATPEPGPDYGKRGETWAADYLRSLGYEILEAGFRTKTGEIDLVAKDGGTLVFVEVKARATEGYGGPEAAVTSQKKRKIAKTAAMYLQKTKLDYTAARFDVIAIVNDRPIHYKDAFPSPIRFTL